MPIEIRELIIRATVREDGGGEVRRPAEREGELREDIVAETVAQVLRILRDEHER